VERERTGIKSLKVGYNRVFGYYIEISRAQQAQAPEDYIRKQTLTTGERYITPGLKEREAVVLNAQQDRVARELEILRLLHARVAEAAPALLATAEAIGELDATCALAEAVIEQHEELDRRITEASDDWTADRLGALERNILRIAIHELDEAETPVEVAINEAVTLAKRYSSEDAGKLVNGILGRIEKEAHA